MLATLFQAGRFLHEILRFKAEMYTMIIFHLAEVL